MLDNLMKTVFALGLVTALIGGAFYGCDRYHRGGVGEECFRDGSCSFGLSCKNLMPNNIYTHYTCVREEKNP